MDRAKLRGCMNLPISNLENKPYDIFSVLPFKVLSFDGNSPVHIPGKSTQYTTSTGSLLDIPNSQYIRDGTF